MRFYKHLNNSTLNFLCVIAWNDFFFKICAKEPIYKKSSENHDFYVAKRFFEFHVFLCDDAIDNMCDRHRPLFEKDTKDCSVFLVSKHGGFEKTGEAML